jgi:prepilin-type N-terminal cleavage/methylation domain-containing protein
VIRSLRPPPPRRLAAFTLLELMVVVALIGILAALAATQVSSASHRANAPVQGVRLHGFLSEARNLARRTNRCVAVNRAPDGSVLEARTFSTCPLTEVCRCRASALPDEIHRLTMDDVSPRGSRVGVFVGTGVIAGFNDVAIADTIIFLADGSTPHPAAVDVTVNVPLEGGAQQTALRIMPATGIVRLVQAGE